jgi:hypothetical protein
MQSDEAGGLNLRIDLLPAVDLAGDETIAKKITA